MRPALLLALLLTGCQMYSGKSEVLHKPTPPHGAVVAAKPTTPPTPTYVDACEVDFHRPPAPKPRRTEVEHAANLVQAGDHALPPPPPAVAVSPPAPPPPATDPAERTRAVVTSIAAYTAALHADPYNALATLKLALAYDQVRYRGCALALLRRLHTLVGHPKLSPDAPAVIDNIEDNTAWFGGYRTEALAALNP